MGFGVSPKPHKLTKKKPAERKKLTYFWVSKSKHPMASYVQLTVAQRYLLQTLYQQKMAQKDIAQHLQVCPSTVSRELRRNRFSFEHPYLATSAQQQTQKRRKRSPYKLQGDLAQQVKKHLKNHWSPEQISRVLALANNGQKCISPEAIYQHIYRQKPENEPLICYLRIRHKKRYKKRGSPQKRGSIPGRVGIEPHRRTGLACYCGYKYRSGSLGG